MADNVTRPAIAASDRYDAALDDAIATCDGDTRGALKALLIANEYLELEIATLRQQLQLANTPARNARAA
jgi:hypothetical protein